MHVRICGLCDKAVRVGQNIKCGYWPEPKFLHDVDPCPLAEEKEEKSERD